MMDVPSSMEKRPRDLSDSLDDAIHQLRFGSGSLKVPPFRFASLPEILGKRTPTVREEIFIDLWLF